MLDSSLRMIRFNAKNFCTIKVIVLCTFFSLSLCTYMHNNMRAMIISIYRKNCNVIHSLSLWSAVCMVRFAQTVAFV